MRDLTLQELDVVRGGDGTIIVNEYRPPEQNIGGVNVFVGTGHVDLTYVSGDGLSVTYGNNTDLGAPNFAGGVQIENDMLANALATGLVTQHAYTVDDAHFYASLHDMQTLAAEAAVGYGSYDIYGQNCVDTVRRETQIAGLPDPANILTKADAVTYYAQRTSSLAGVALMDLELGIPLELGLPAYLFGGQIGSALNGVSNVLDVILGLPVGMNPASPAAPVMTSDPVFVTPDSGANAVILSTDAHSILQFVNDSNVLQLPPTQFDQPLQGVPDVVLVESGASAAFDGGGGNWGGDWGSDWGGGGGGGEYTSF